MTLQENARGDGRRYVAHDHPAAVSTRYGPPGVVAASYVPRATGPRTSSVRSTRAGMRCDRMMPLEPRKPLGAKLGTDVNASACRLADWLVFGQVMYGRRDKDAIAEAGLDDQTLRNDAVVSRRFPLSRRRDSLSFQHHAEVRALSDDAPHLWLDHAVAHRSMTNELRRSAASPQEPFRRSGHLILTLDEERERRGARRGATQPLRIRELGSSRALDEAARHGVSPGG